jgi:hypothetical protein
VGHSVFIPEFKLRISADVVSTHIIAVNDFTPDSLSFAALIFQSLAVSFRTTRLNIKKFYIVLALCSETYKDLRTDSGLCCIRHKLIGFCKCGGNCLQRGTAWFLI